MQEVNLNNIKFGDKQPLVLIAGPCVIESASSSLAAAKKLKEITSRLDIPFIFKSSFDKANRLSFDSYRGPGIKKGLEILQKIKQQLKIPILSDVHCAKDMAVAGKVLDIIQIPAFLSRQTDIVLAAAATGRVVNIKKGQFLAPWDILPIIKKIESAGNKKILITERGASFGYNNLVTDLRSLKIIRDFGYPVIYDATHSVQLPGGQGSCSSGQSEFVPGLARAAVAFGCDGLFLEVHNDPKNAPCDGLNMINYQELEALLKQIKKIRAAL